MDEFAPPRDGKCALLLTLSAYMSNYVIGKIENKKFLKNPKFEEIVTKYWQLLRSEPDADLTINAITRDQYIRFMKCVYKVLLPLYRDKEMQSEIENEWLMENANAGMLSLHLFSRVLFRVANQWAVHIDLEEYVELLEKIYERITVRKALNMYNGTSKICYPTIFIDIIADEEEKEQFTPNPIEVDQSMFEKCEPGEPVLADHEYHWLEEPETMTAAKHKRPKIQKAPPRKDGIDFDVPVFTIKDAMDYVESVKYYQNAGDHKPSEDDVVSYQLAELKDIIPLGYATEQFIVWTRNDITEKLEEGKRARKEAMARMKRQAIDEGGSALKDQAIVSRADDSGMVENPDGLYEVRSFPMTLTSGSKARAKFKLVDKLYNAFRTSVKECNQVNLRPKFEFPRRNIQGVLKSKPSGATEPGTEINSSGYNPILQRRLIFKQVPLFTKKGKMVFMNINYMYEHPDYASAYRSDYEKYEKAGKLAVEKTEGSLVKEEFTPCQTGYKKMREIMLWKKFETIYTEKSLLGAKDPLEEEEGDAGMLQDQILQAEDARKQKCRTADAFNSKGLSQTFEEKNNLIKMMKGPYFKMLSGQGLKDDNFVTCAQQDLIDYVNKQVPRVLILGKPRSGKTTLAGALAKKLDLMHISVENWLSNFMKKVAEEPEPEEPPEEPDEDYVPPPPYYTDLEKRIKDRLTRGKGPTHLHNVLALKMEMNSDLAQTKGYVLDLTYYRIPVDEEETEEEEPAPATPEKPAEGDGDGDAKSGMDGSQDDKEGGELEAMKNAPDQADTWMKVIRNFKLLGEDIELGYAQEFSHIIELDYEDEEIKLRAKNIRLNNDPTMPPENPDDEDKKLPFAETSKLTSRWDRVEFAKPPPPQYDEDGTLIEVDPEDLPKPLAEDELYERIQDDDEHINQELRHYVTIERPNLDDFMMKLNHDQFLKIDAAGKTPDEILASASWLIQPDESIPLKPKPVKVEAGDFAELLTVPIPLPNGEDPPEGTLPRQYSLWQQTDPVELTKGRVVPGTAEFSVAFANNMFCFETEESQTAFMTNPRKYLTAAPEMPKQYRLMMLGPRGIGVHTQAEKLSKMYGWKIVDYPQLVKDRLTAILQEEVHLPNNIDPDEAMIGLSAKEIEHIKEGKPFPSWKFLPWVLDELGYALMERPQPEEPPSPTFPPEDWEEKSENTQKVMQKEHQKRQRAKDEVAKAKIAREESAQRRRSKRQELEEAGAPPEEIAEFASVRDPPDDLSIENLVLAPDEDGKLPPVGGFIMLGFPHSQIHIEKLKEYNFEFDKVIYLTDTNEEGEPGKEVRDRMEVIDMHYDWEFEAEKASKQRAAIEQFSGPSEEEPATNIIDIQATGGIEDVYHKIEMEIDPFVIRVDTYERGEPEKPPPKGEFADFCPVTYMKENWLYKCPDGNMELETTVFGKTFRFSGEAEMEEFKFNPAKFLVGHKGKEDLPLLPPPPKVMIIGQKGAGVSTQIDKLCKKYVIDSLNLKDRFTTIMSNEAEARKRKRLLERGFKPPEVDDEGVVAPDPEIEDEAEDFDKEANEKTLIRNVFNESDKGYIIDGTWNGFAEDQVTVVDGAAFVQLLADARRLPEVIIALTCSEKNSIERMIDYDAIKKEFDEKNDAREAEIKKLKDEAREAESKRLTEEAEAAAAEDPEYDKAKTIDEGMAAWEEENAENVFDVEEITPLEELQEAALTTLTDQRAADEEFLEALTGACEEKAITLKTLTTDISADYVHLKLADMLKEYFPQRDSLIERNLAMPLSAKDLPFYEESFTYKQSKFGMNCPMHQANPAKTKDFAVLYRERIYYIGSAEGQAMFLSDPSKFTKGVEACPLDVSIKPASIVIGPPKSGKSTLCAQVAKDTGAVHLKIDEIVAAFVDKASPLYKDRDSVQLERLLKTLNDYGQSIEDNQVIQLIVKRIQQRDCLENGWLLEDFPKTKAQAIALSRANIQPATIISLSCPYEKIIKRQEKDVADTLAKIEADEEAARKAALENEDEVSQPPEDLEEGQVPKGKIAAVKVPPEELFSGIKSILAERIRGSQANMTAVSNFYRRIYNSVIDVDASKSKWFVLDKASTFIEANLRSRQLFTRAQCFTGEDERPTEMQYLHYDQALLKEAISQFGYHCPVTWKNAKQLLKCTHNIDLCVLYGNCFYYFKGEAERAMFLMNPKRFVQNVLFSSAKGIPVRVYIHKAAETLNQEKALVGHCPVSLVDEKKVVMGDPLLLVYYKERKFLFESEKKLQAFIRTPGKYVSVELPTKMPPAEDPVSLSDLQGANDSTIFMEQALGSIVTKGLREVSENRLKHPNMSVKETMLKLFALFLKADNPANTDYMREKYSKKMKEFVTNCEMAEELHALSEEKKSKGPEGWPEFKEKYYFKLGANFERTMVNTAAEKKDNFKSYLK